MPCYVMLMYVGLSQSTPMNQDISQHSNSLIITTACAIFKKNNKPMQCIQQMSKGKYFVYFMSHIPAIKHIRILMVSRYY